MKYAQSLSMQELRLVQDTTSPDYLSDRRLAQWSTDDARPARLVSRDAQHDNQLSQQCYVLILWRGAALKSTLRGALREHRG